MFPFLSSDLVFKVCFGRIFDGGGEDHRDAIMFTFILGTFIRVGGVDKHYLSLLAPDN
jgi:hypothetical protein